MAIDYKEKIKKLLALSESTNEHEAKAALLKARKLMMEHNISITDTEEECDNRIVEAITKITYTTRKNVWIYKLGDVIAKNHRCSVCCYRPRGKKTRTILFIGHEEDIKICNEIFLYALDCVMSKEKEIHKNGKTAAEKTSLFNNYGEGFVTGLEEAYQEQNKEYGWGLIALMPKDVDDYLKDHTCNKSSNIPKSDKSSEAYMSGISDGKEFDQTKRITA